MVNQTLSTKLKDFVGQKLQPESEATSQVSERNTVETVNTNPWLTKPIENLHDYKEQGYQFEIPSHTNTNESLLFNANIIIKQIYDLVIESNCLECSLDLETDEQTFTCNSKRFLLKNKNLISKIQEIITETPTQKAYDSITTKQNVNLLKGLDTIIEEKIELLTNDFLKGLSPITIAKAIVAILNKSLAYKFFKKDYSYEFKAQNLATTLGNTLLSTKMSMLYLYDNTEYNSKGPQDNQKIRELKKRSDEELCRLVKVVTGMRDALITLDNLDKAPKVEAIKEVSEKGNNNKRVKQKDLIALKDQ